MSSSQAVEDLQQNEQSSRWVKYRCVKRAVQDHMTCVSINKHAFKSCIVDKRPKFTVDSQDVDDDNVGCSSTSWHSDDSVHADDNEDHSIVSFIDTSDTCSSPRFTVAKMTEGVLESDGYDISDCNSYVSLMEGNVDESGVVVDSDVELGVGNFADDDEDDDGIEHNNDLCLRDELASWALKHRTSHVAVSDLLKILSKYHSLPKDARTLLKTSSLHPVLPMKDMLGGDGDYAYFGIEKQILRNLSDIVNERSVQQLELLFNVDGLPLFRSSSKQFWPILCAACIDGVITKPFVIAVFCGSSKPISANVFLRDFVKELNHLQESGVCFDDTFVSISVKGFICDAPARAFIKCIKGHSGYYACEKCVDRGKQVNQKMTFPNLDAQKRSDDSFVRQTQEEHHKGVSPLISLNVGLVTHVPLEYMHLICLGAMRRLLMVHWLRGEHNVRISMHIASLISNQLLQLKPYVCSEFQRKPRALSDIDRWKAVEFRLFLCYLGPVVLRGNLLPDLYHHFMLLHCAVVMLLDPLHARQRCEDANHLLRQFVSQLRELYGVDSTVYTMHNLIHVTDDVQVFGALDCYSAFAFESALGQLKRLLRSGKAPLRQLCRRLVEQSNVHNRTCKTSSLPVLSIIHCDGPTCGVNGLQYNKMNYLGYSFSCNSTADCYALLKCGKVVKILNFIEGDTLVFIGHTFEDKRSFYSYPCDSQLLNVFKLSHLCDKAFVFCCTDIVRKCLLLPRKSYFICFPLLHRCQIF